MPDQPKPETFAELVESWKLQPYQERILDNLFGMKVDILPDPFDDKVGYIFNREALPKGDLTFIDTPGPDSLYDLLMEKPPRYVHQPAMDWWKAADLFKATQRMLILDDVHVEYVPPDWGNVAMQRFYGTFAD